MDFLQRKTTVVCMVLERRMSMTENEVFEHISNLAGDYKCFDEKISHQESLILCNLIEEVQQYRAIGTIEEFKALKEKSVAKKPLAHDDCENYLIRCTCGKCTDTRFFHGFCTWCGQALET